MSTKFILAIDQGTTGSTANIIDAAGDSVARVNCEFRQIYPQPGWVEHNPEDIWQSVLNSVAGALSKSGINSTSIAALGITNQRETVVMWDRQTGQPLYNAIVWQCRRTTDRCEKLKRRSRIGQMIKRKTGLVIDPYFSASKIEWLLNNCKGAKKMARDGRICVGTIDSYLLWRFSGGQAFCTDVSNASRTQLMNIGTGDWDDALLKLFSIPRQILPKICASNEIFATTRGVPGLPDGLPIAALIGDQQAALFGQACFRAGDAKCTFGTGSFILMNSGPQMLHSKAGLLTTVAWRLRNEKHLTYALEGGAFICGAAVQWLRDGLKMFSKSSEVEALAQSVSGTDGVEFVPALTGLGAPHWKPEARGALTGLTRGTTNAHIARATLEAMALQNLDILRAMEHDIGHKMRILKVDGGASANNLLMQIQSNYLGCRIDRPQMVETTSLGAAYLAGLSVGLWKDLSEIQKIRRSYQIFAPHMTSAARRARLARWQSAINKI
jgi:glycerol kinase